MDSGRQLLRAWMGRMRFNQSDTAEYLGISKAELSLYLSRERTPGLDRALHIERMTGIPVEAWSSELGKTSKEASSDRDNTPVSRE